MKSDDLIRTARMLARSIDGELRQSDLRRSVSTSYYAVFHALAKECADLVVGGRGSERAERAWAQVYRSLNHRSTREQCRRVPDMGFPDEIVSFASSFVELQEQRHSADYDPAYSVTQNEAELRVYQAQFALLDLKRTPIKHRRAFCAWAAFPGRRTR